MATHIEDESIGLDANLTPPIDKTAMSAERRRLFERVEQINRTWLESMRQMRRAEAEFSIHLFSCETREAAMALCGQWLETRKEIMEGEQSAFEAAWAELQSLLAYPSALKHRRSGKSPSHRE